ncbi:serine integrase [Streptomyces phage Verse]|uniref:Serine integrase n=1 Tax=Streptomyces phage Verse TaxID=1673878 RepID=A0A0K1Y9V5_9CAUD|nr:serine integrase [Streptomyces phage Verse]
MSKRAVIYTRVSRDDTGEGQSNQRQEAECRRLTDYRRLDVVAVEADISISASKGLERPAWLRVLGMIERGEVDYVIAYHMDRVTRSMTELEQLIEMCLKYDVGVATVSGDIDLTTDVGRMVARIIGAVARAEVERKSARQKLANAQRAAEGKPHVSGIRPFGYADDHRQVVTIEAQAIRAAAEAALAGESMIGIAESWSKDGLLSARARRGHDKGNRPTKAAWSARGVRNVLVNPRYAGIRFYNGERVGQGDWEPILDVETHLRLVEKLTDPTRRKGTVKTGRVAASLLTAIARCEVCGQTVRASSVRGRQTYACRNSHAHVDRSTADLMTQEWVISRLADPDTLAKLAPSGDDRVDEAKATIEKRREALKTYARLLATGAMDEDQFTEASAVARSEMQEAEAVLTEAGTGDLLAGLDVGSDAVGPQFLALSLARQRGIVEALVDVTLRPASKARKVVTPEHERVILADR